MRSFFFFFPRTGKRWKGGGAASQRHLGRIHGGFFRTATVSSAASLCMSHSLCVCFVICVCVCVTITSRFPPADARPRCEFKPGSDLFTDTPAAAMAAASCSPGSRLPGHARPGGVDSLCTIYQASTYPRHSICLTHPLCVQPCQAILENTV